MNRIPRAPPRKSVTQKAVNRNQIDESLKEESKQGPIIGPSGVRNYEVPDNLDDEDESYSES